MRHGRLCLATVLVVAAAAGPAIEPTASVQAAPSRTVDRTFVCNPVAYAGVSDVDLRARPPYVDRRLVNSTTALLSVRTDTTLPTTDLVFVRVLAQPRIGWTYPYPGPAGVYAHRARCKASRLKPPLSAQGLPGPPYRFASDLTCSLRGRIVVRVRARLATTAEWSRGNEPYLVGASGRVLGASVAVRGARSGAPLAYMTVDRAGATRMWWSSNRCF